MRFIKRTSAKQSKNGLYMDSSFSKVKSLKTMDSSSGNNWWGHVSRVFENKETKKFIHNRKLSDPSQVEEENFRC